MYDVACQVLEYKFEAIESDYHRNADVLYGVEVINLGTVNNLCGKQIIVLVGREHLHIGGSEHQKIHSDHLAISNDMNHDRSIE